MNGPTICRLPCGSARRTSNPSPRSRVRGTMTSSSASQERGSPSMGSLEGCQLMGNSLHFAEMIAGLLDSSHVIASEAKQSMGGKASLDCFVACAPRNDGGKHVNAEGRR